MRLTADDYRDMAATLATSVGARRTAYFLEGGYDLEAVSGSVAATLRGASGTEPAEPAPATTATTALRTLDYAVGRLSEFWELD